MKTFRQITLSLILFFMATMLYAQPKMEIVGGNTKDWGDVKPEDSPLKTTIVIKNVSTTDSLHIMKVKAGCGCTSTKPDKDWVAPGDEAKVDVTLKMNNYSGNVTKTITISTNDPDQARVIYRLKCNVIKPLNLSRRFFNIGRINPGDDKKATVVLTNNSDTTITIKKITKRADVVPAGEKKSKNNKGNDAIMQLNIKEDYVLHPKGKVNIDLRFTTEKTGNIRGNITLFTDHPDHTRLPITVYGTSVDPEEEKKKRAKAREKAKMKKDELKKR